MNNREYNPLNHFSTIKEGFLSGNWIGIGLSVFAGACFFYGAVAFYDGLNGRGCNGPEHNDPFSWGKSLGCAGRGILEPAPRAKTQPKVRVD